MSGLYKNKGSERITNEETLLVREELLEFISSKNKFKLIDSGLRDQFNHSNLLLPNFLIDKPDNGDIDIFLYYNQSNNKFTESLLQKIKNNVNILEINKNDKTYSLLYKSDVINKLIQIDLHIIPNNQNNLYNYFNYYRVPYLFMLFGVLFNSINIKIGTKGVFLLVDVNGNKRYIKIEHSMYNFLYNILGLNENELENIKSFQDIANLINKTGLYQYNFFETDQSNIKQKHKRKIRNNIKVDTILSYINKGNKTRKDFRKEITPLIYREYPYIEKKKKRIEKEILKNLEEKEKRIIKLEYIFNDKLKNVGKEKTSLIGKLNNVLDELVELKKITEKSINKYNKTLYLVGGAVRDILLGLGNKDWDLTGELTPQEFVNLVGGGTITDKLGTVFYKTKSGLEIEYTPFRCESGYDGRRPENVVFGVSLKEDANRRDFTINSLYMNLYNLDIIDYFGGIKDLDNKIVRFVGNSEQRIQEDYLRLLRGIRLSVKLLFNIEKDSFDNIVKYFNYGINHLSIERLNEEIFKGLLLNNRKYLEIIDYLFFKTGLLNYSILEKWYSIIKSDVLSLILIIFKGNISFIKKLSGNQIGKHKNIFIYAYEKIIFKGIHFDLLSIQNEKDLTIFLLGLNNDYNNKETIYLLIVLLNNLILENRINKKETNKILNYFKNIIKKNIIYNIKNIKNLNISIPQDISKSKIRKYLIEESVRRQFIL